MKPWEPLDTFLALRARWLPRVPAQRLVSLVMSLLMSLPASLLPLALAQAQPIQATQPTQPAEPGASVERGRVLLAQYQCGSCHTIPGVQAARGDSAQTLRAWSRRSYIAGRHPNRPDVLVQWIMAPQSLVPGTAMPSMGVSRPDAQHIAAYLLSLP